jgi:hypothetical protein
MNEKTEHQPSSTLNLDQRRMEQDARRATRSQEKAIAETHNMIVGMIKPFVAFQTAMLKNWSDSLDLVARNYESQVQTISEAAEEQRQRVG